jgi:hypothetical protein
VQGGFESSKNPVGILAREGVAVNGRSGLIGNTFMVGFVVEDIRAVGFDGHFFYFVIYSNLTGGLGVRGLAFQLLNNPT